MNNNSNNTENDPLVSSTSNIFDQNPLPQINNGNTFTSFERPNSRALEYPGYRYVQPEDSSSFDSAILLMLTISFISSVSFSVALPSLWYYIYQLGGELDILGWAIALHSGGSIVASPVLIAWSRRRSLRAILTGSLVLMAGGGVMHGLAQDVPMLLAARFFIGAGSANYVITTSYLSQVSRRTRDRALAYNGIVSIAGFIVGPAVAVGFTPIRYSQSVFVLNECTSPGYLIASLSLCAAAFTCCAPMQFLRKRVRRQRPESFDPNSSQPQVFNNSAVTYDIAGSLLNYGLANSGYYYTELGSVDELPSMLRELWVNRERLPLTQLLVCFFIYFDITLAFTIWETLGPALTHRELGWDVTENGMLFAGMGIVSGLTLILLVWLTKVCAGRLILPGAALLMVVGASLLAAFNSWTLSIFIPAIALIAIGYTGSVSMVIHVYGRVLELSTEVPTPPAAVGWLSSCGSVARVLGPVCVAYLLRGTDLNPLWLMVLGSSVPAVAVLVVIVAYKRLPP